MSVSVPIAMPKKNVEYLDQLWLDSPFLFNRMLDFCNDFINEKLLDNSSYKIDARTLLDTGVMCPEIDSNPENPGFHVLFWSFQDAKYVPMSKMDSVDLRFLYHFMHYISRSN